MLSEGEDFNLKYVNADFIIVRFTLENPCPDIGFIDGVWSLPSHRKTISAAFFE